MITISMGVVQCRCSKATKLHYLRCDPKAPPLADGERCRPYSGDWESAMLWGWEEPKNVVWLMISMMISMIIQYISMIFTDYFNDSCPVSGGYFTHTWCCHNFLGWTLEVIAMFQNRWESSGNGVKRPRCVQTTNLNCSMILHQCDLSPIIVSSDSIVKKRSRRSCTLPRGPWSWSLDTWTNGSADAKRS